MLQNYIKTITRNILRNKMFSIINIAGMAIGLMCTLFLLLWVRTETSYDKFHNNANRLHRVAFNYKPLDVQRYTQAGALAYHLKDNFEEITHACNMVDQECKIAFNEKGFFQKGIYTDSDFFSMFTFPFAAGNASTAFSDPRSVVLTQEMKEKIFGSQEAVGETVKLNDNTLLQVTGVLQPFPGNTDIEFDFLVPFELNAQYWNHFNSKNSNTYVMLDKKASYQDVSDKIAGVMDQFQPTWENTLFLQPLVRDHLHPVFGSSPIIYVYIFSSIAFIVLLLACINFMNLSTAQADKRSKEIGIRKVIGSTRSMLAKQFLGESLLYSIFAMILAIALVKLLLPVFNNLLNLNIMFSFDPVFYIGLVVMTIFTGLCAGSYPALYLSTLVPQSILKRTNTRQRKFQIRQVLVLVQFILSIAFIAAILIISNQLSFIQNKELGFTKENMLVVKTQGDLGNQGQLLKQKLLELDQIKNVTFSHNNLTNWNVTGPLKANDTKDKLVIEYGYNWVDMDFAETLDLKMAEGRFFSKEFSTDMQDAVVINKKAAELLGFDDPIGQTIESWFGQKGKIIGVIQDYHTTSLHFDMMPFILYPTEQSQNMLIRMNPGNISKTIDLIQQTIHEIVPDDPFYFNFLDESINSMYRLEQRTGKLVMISAILAIFISCLGLFGLVTFAAERRVKEFGVRKILGASLINVSMIIANEFTGWIIIANIIAWPATWYAMHKWLQNFAYKIDLTIWPFLFAGLAALAIAMLTVSFQTIKTARTNPVNSLRYE